MKKLSLKQQFVRFLMAHGVLKKFYSNRKNKSLPLQGSPKRWVDFAFSWRHTKEGHAYWYRIYNLWDLYLKELESVKTITLCGVKWLVENEVKVDGNTYFTADEAILHLEGTKRRLPTKEEFDSLCKLSNCWDDIKNGRWFAECESDLKNPDRSIFLPAFGCKYGEGIRYYVESYGFYWSSTSGKYLEFYCNGTGMSYASRSSSFSVRCILNE